MNSVDPTARAPESGTAATLSAAPAAVHEDRRQGNQTQYSYDAFGRVTQARHYVNRNGFGEDLGQRIDYHYDSNPLDAGFTQNGWGRLTSAEFHARGGFGMQYLYSYNQSGRVTAQRMVATPPDTEASPIVADATYQWDTEGRMTSLTGPSNGPTDTYSYDAMGRLSSGGATYGPAGELLTFNGVTRTYNSLGQVTRMTRSGLMDVEYRYAAGQNNGCIYQSADYVTGETVSYTYDALNRLSRAETADASWGNAYSYDGWGNLLSKTVTKGTAPVMSVNIDPTLNMPVGSAPPNSNMDPSRYDVEGRPVQGTAEWTRYPYNGALTSGQVSYDPFGKKVVFVAETTWWDESPQATMKCEIYFHAITGQRLARYGCKRTEWTDAEQTTHQTVESGLFDRTQHIGGS